jgi:Fic family protein
MADSVFLPPTLDPLEQRVISMIETLRQDLRHRVAEPRRWVGSLRRMTLARAVQGSNSIEGYNASLDDVVAAVEDEPTLSASLETQHALTGYRDAMTYVLQVAHDQRARIDEGLLKALHFMMLKHELAKSPGHWRPGYIAVRNDELGTIVYEGPEADRVPDLIAAMLAQLDEADGPVVVRAAMAHLNLVMIHPFRDGNGRMARCLQTLVLAREGIVAPVFSSVEEYLGRNTQAYYDVLAEVGQGRWSPERDARPWIRFCLTAHHRQATTHLRRVAEIERLWVACNDLAAKHQLPERTTGALADAAMGLRVRNASYRSVVEATAGEEVSELTASRDLKALVNAGLFAPVGERRGRYYVADPSLEQVGQEIRAARPPRETVDPFELAAQDLQLSFDG